MTGNGAGRLPRWIRGGEPVCDESWTEVEGEVEGEVEKYAYHLTSPRLVSESVVSR